MDEQVLMNRITRITLGVCLVLMFALGFESNSFAITKDSNRTTYYEITSQQKPSSTSIHVANTNDGIKISWDKVSDASGYFIYRKSGFFYSQLSKVNGNSTIEFIDKTAENGETYTYAVTAFNDAGESGKDSAEIMRLSSPAISKLYNSAAKILRVKWNKNSKAKFYEIQYAENNTFSEAKAVTTDNKETITYDIKNLKNGITYYARVRSCYSTITGKKYYSAWSGKKKYIAFGKPVIASFKASASNALTLKWNKNSLAQGYQIQYATNKDFSDAKTLKVTSYATTSKKMSGLSNGKTYYVRVRNYKTLGSTTCVSVWSNSRKYTALSSVAISSIKNKGSGEISLSWEKNTKADGYQIQVSKSSKMKNDDIYTTSSTSKTISDLDSATKYYIRVRCVKTVGNTKMYSVWSGKKSITTKKSSSDDGGNSGVIVYITTTGKKYHTAACRYAHGDGVTAITLSEAIRRGYEPCLICH